jgi:hypothetical protein
MSKTKYGSFEELLQITADSQQATAVRLRKIILSIHPDACEVVRLGDRAATYGLGPKKMSEGYVYILPHTSWVNLGFFKGADLSDPDGLLEGTGKKLRHVKIRSAAEADNPKLITLIKAALAERQQALGI